MTRSENMGRLLVLMFSALILLVSAAVIGLYVATRGTDRLGDQSIRFVLTVALCWWLYQGDPTARWIAVCLLGGAGLLALFRVGGDDPVVTALTGGMAAVYLSFAAVVAASPSVAAFLARQRALRSERERA